MLNVLTFEIGPKGESLVPFIDGTSLVDSITEFERNQGYTDPTGGYSGLLLSDWRIGRTFDYFLGLDEPVELENAAEIYVLQCACGNPGCWPLIAHVRVTGPSVIWERFENPHREARDYSAFGPFEFNREQYEACLPDINEKKMGFYLDQTIERHRATLQRLSKL